MNEYAFPDSAQWNLMGRSGIYDPSIFNANDDTISCNDGEGMVAVLASKFDSVSGTGVKAYGKWNRYDVQTLVDWTTANIKVSFHTPTRKSIKVMCARINKIWRFTAFTSIRKHFNPFVVPEGSFSKDVLIVGSGMGGMAVAANLHGADVAVLSPGASTSEQSTGVVWFPNASKHTPDMLLQAYGAPPNDDDNRIRRYIDQGNDAFAFWNSVLDLKPYAPRGQSSYDYTQYTEGAINGQSFQMNSCDNPLTCGSKTIQTLRNKSKATFVTGRAFLVETLPDGQFVVYFGLNGSFVVAPVLVIASGGDGNKYQHQRPVLALGNNGFASFVQEHLELTPTESCFYHLEFSSQDDSNFQARWFALDACVPSQDNNADFMASTQPGYDLCYDYSRRSQVLQSMQNEFTPTNTIKGNYNCSTEHGKFWYDLMEIYGADYTSCPQNLKLKAGIIDSKTAFKVDSHYESIDMPRLFASGTSAAAFTKDAYFAPGATLGLGLVTGYEISKLVPQRLKEYRESQKGEPNEIDARQCAAPILFISAVWVYAFGIAVHYFSKRHGKVHYWAMAAGTLLVTAGVIIARDCGKGYVKSKDTLNGDYHYYAGYTLLGILWAQTLFGIGLKIYDMLEMKRPKWQGGFHRSSGYLLCVLLAAQYFTPLLPRDAYAMQYYDSYSHTGLIVSAALFTALVVLYTPASFLYVKGQAQQQKSLALFI